MKKLLALLIVGMLASTAYAGGEMKEVCETVKDKKKS